MRLFIAINFGSDAKDCLLALRDELSSHSIRGNFSLPDNLHLTLAFLGECDGSETTAAKTAMDSVAYTPLSILIERVGRFKRNGGDIWWAGVRESRPLLALQANLTDKLIVASFELDQRKYNPHITLGREVITNVDPWEIEPFGEAVSSIELMKSERIGGKLTYTAIYSKRAAP